MIVIETLDHTNWIPVELTNDTTRTTSLSSYTQEYTSGIALHHSELLTNVLDVSVQRNAFAALLDVQSLAPVFSERTTITTPDFIGSCLLVSIDGKAITFNPTTLVPELCSIGTANQYHVFVTEGDRMEIKQGENYSLTVNLSANALMYSTRLDSERDRQLFNYTLSGDKLTLWTSLSSLSAQRIVQFSAASSLIVLASSQFISGAPVSGCNFWTLPSAATQFHKGHDYVTKTVQYYNDFGPESANSGCSLNSTHTTPTSGNFLATFPIKTAIDGLAPTTIVPLKNTYDSTFQQTPNASQLGLSSTSELRKYDRIVGEKNSDTSGDFTLSYHDNAQMLVFPCDKTTVFHFPYNAARHALSASDLAVMGATPATAPAFSDRIQKNLFGYSCTTGNGTNTQAPKNGTLLCSWLSGNSTVSRWVDRWYDSNHISQGAALFATITSTATTVNSSSHLWDVPSTMVLEPGGCYNYFRQGPVSQARSLFDTTAANLVLAIDQWYPPIDSSVYRHAIVANGSDVNLGKDQPFAAQGFNSLSIACTPALTIQDQFSFATWIYCADWQSVNADLLAGNFYESGFGITITNGVPNIQNIVFGDGNYGFVTVVDNQYGKRNQIKLPTVIAVPSINCIATTREFSKWILDTSNHAAYLVDQNAVLQTTISLPTSASFSYIDVDSNNDVYAFDTTSNTLVKFNRSGVLSVDVISPSANNFVIDLYDNIVEVICNPGTKAMVDSHNNIWRIVGANVYKNDRLVFHSGSQTRALAIDIQDNIWVARAPGQLYKLDDRGLLQQTVKLPDVINSDDLTLNMIREQTFDGASDYVVVGSAARNRMVKLSIDGNLLACVNLKSVADIDVNRYPDDISATLTGDFTGYDIHRKYDNGKNVIAKIRTRDNSGVSQTVSVSYPASALLGGWHHFTMTFGSDQGVARLYIDGNLVGSEQFEPQTRLVDYKYKSPIVFGADPGKYGLLKQELGFSNTAGFVGLFDKARYYNKILSIDQIRALFAQRTQFDDLSWKLHTNNRYPAVEQIAQWFTHRLQTHKSNKFDIAVKGLQISDTTARQLIEQAITLAVQRIKPGHTQLRQILWV